MGGERWIDGQRERRHANHTGGALGAKPVSGSVVIVIMPAPSFVASALRPLEVTKICWVWGVLAVFKVRRCVVVRCCEWSVQCAAGARKGSSTAPSLPISCLRILPPHPASPFLLFPFLSGVGKRLVRG